MRIDKIVISLLSVAFAVLVIGTYRCSCCLVRAQEQVGQVTDFAEIGETVRTIEWELRVHNKYVALRKNVVFRHGSGGSYLQLIGELKAASDAYILDVHFHLQNLRDETVPFELADFSIGKGDFTTTPGAYLDFTEVKSGIPIATREAEFSLGSKQAGSYLLSFPVKAAHPHFFLRFKNLKPIKIGEIGNPRDIRPWVAKLQDPNVANRKQAVKALREIGYPKAVEPLIASLNDDNNDIRLSVVVALGEMGGKQAVEPLIGLLSDPSTQMQGNAALALGKIGDPRAGKPLLNTLAKMSSYRNCAVEALGEIGYEPAVELLIDVLQNDAPRDNRKAAASALGKIGDANAVEPLITALRTDKMSQVRKQAIYALRQLKDPRAVEPLIEVLGNKKLRDFQQAAAEALGSIGDQRAIGPLIAALTQKDEYSNLRIPVEEALDLIDPAWRKSKRAKEAASQCIAALKDEDPRIRKAAAWELQCLEDTRALEPLIAALKDENTGVRMAAAYALDNLDSPSAVNPLIAALKDPDPSVRRAAATALGVMKASQALDALEKLIEKDSDADVRKAAKLALEKLGTTTNGGPLRD